METTTTTKATSSWWGKRRKRSPKASYDDYDYSDDDDDDIYALLALSDYKPEEGEDDNKGEDKEVPISDYDDIGHRY